MRRSGFFPSLRPCSLHRLMLLLRRGYNEVERLKKQPLDPESAMAVAP